MKFTFLFINLAKIHIFIPKCTEEGGPAGFGNISKKTILLDLFPKKNTENRQNRQQSYLFSFFGVVMRVNEDDRQLQVKIISYDAMKTI